MEATRDWLRGVLGPYHHRDRVFRDADTVLVNYNGLAPKTDTYTHEDGRTVVLLCLHGTIPIKFRGITYNIPIAVWMPTTYPMQPPICFVTPTSTMLVRASKHVDLSGKIYHPYLAYWHMNTDDSNLLQFIRLLQDVFANEPPVYSKPTNTPPNNAANTNYQPPGYSPTNQPPANFQNAPRPNYAQQQQTNYYASTPQLSMPDPRRHTTPPPTQNRHTPPIPPAPSNYPLGSQTSSPQQPAQRPHSTPPPPIPHKPLAASIDGQAYQSTLDAQVARLNALREAVRNKLRQKQATLNGTVSADIDRLLTVNKKLMDGEAKLNENIARLKEDEQKIRSNIEVLQEKNKEIAESIETLRKQPDVNVDEVFDGATVVHNQLFDLVAEDHAIDDTLYYLGKALDAEKLEPTLYMKYVRTLAREQFMKRALIKKICQHAGLPEVL